MTNDFKCFTTYWWMILLPYLYLNTLTLATTFNLDKEYTSFPPHYADAKLFSNIEFVILIWQRSSLNLSNSLRSNNV